MERKREGRGKDGGMEGGRVCECVCVRLCACVLECVQAACMNVSHCYKNIDMHLPSLHASKTCICTKRKHVFMHCTRGQ